jgi:hypothetical protein
MSCYGVGSSRRERVNEEYEGGGIKLMDLMYENRTMKFLKLF